MEITGSIIELEDVIIKSAKKYLNEDCVSRCSINVTDNFMGIDYYMWLEETMQSNNIRIIINTSIHHPKHLKFRTNISPTIIIGRFGNVFSRNL